MYFKKNTTLKSYGGGWTMCTPLVLTGLLILPLPPSGTHRVHESIMCGSALLIRHTTKERKESCRLLRGLNLYIYIFGLLYFPMVWFWLVFFLGRYFTCIFIVICLLILFFVLIIIKFMFISSHHSMRDLCELISNKILSWT